MNRIAASLFLLGGAASCGAADASSKDGASESQHAAIVSGTPSDGDRSVVALRSNGQTFCTGTIAARKMVVTAAHCLREFNVDAPLRGIVDSVATGDGRTISVEGTIVHPEFDPIRLANDVAVVFLTESADASSISPLASQPLDGMEGASLRIVGFGVGGDKGSKTAGEGRLDRVDPLTFVLKPSPAEPCAGDSGGPAFLHVSDRDFLVGIVSSGDVACRDHGTYTRVDVYRAWIDQQLVAEEGREPRREDGDDGSGAQCALVPGRTRSTLSLGFFLFLLVAGVLGLRRFQSIRTRRQ